MDSINCAIFSESLAKELGKRESESDLEFYHRTYGERRLSFILPKGHPEKINPLLQALHLSQCVVLEVNEINAVLGEIIVALDAMGKEKGFLIAGELVDETLLGKVVSGTVAEGYERISKNEILGKVGNTEMAKADGETIVDMDSMFTVRSVGTVGLGFVLRGKVEKFQKLGVFPGIGERQEALVKSIQKQDKDVQDAGCYDRVGLSLKGITPDGFSRGLVLAEGDEFKPVNEVKVSFGRSKFWKGEFGEGVQLHLQCRLQVVGCKVKSKEPLVLELGKTIAARSGEKVALIDIGARPRVIGAGTIE